MSEIHVSIVAPFFNEREALLPFVQSLRRVCEGLGQNYEVILVDDGSTDGTVDTLSDLEWPECRVVQLYSNSGHQNALEAGLKQTSGSWVVTMDADGQHPPELIPVMLGEIHIGKQDVVYAIPNNRKSDARLKRMTARWYYSVMRAASGVRMRANAADFRIMSRGLVDQLNAMPEEKVYRLLIPSLGLNEGQVEYELRARALGHSKYTPTKMLTLGLRSVVGFSPLPLRWVSIAGVVSALIGFALILFVMTSYLVGSVVSGWSSVMVVVLFFGGIQLLAVGVIGEYLISVQQIVRQRPRYLIKRTMALTREIT